MSQLLVNEGEEEEERGRERKRQKERKETETEKKQRKREKRNRNRGNREKRYRERERERKGGEVEGRGRCVCFPFSHFLDSFLSSSGTMSQADFMAADSRMNKRIKVEEVSIIMRVTLDTLMTLIQPQDRGYGHSAGYYGHSNSRYAGGGRSVFLSNCLSCHLIQHVVSKQKRGAGKPCLTHHRIESSISNHLCKCLCEDSFVFICLTRILSPFRM